MQKIVKHIKNNNLNINQLTPKFVFRFWILFICVFSSFSASTQLFVHLESGAFFTEINDIRNGSNGTLFSLKNDFQTSSSPFIRLRVGYISNSKNHFSFLYAPLKIIESGTIEKNILFEGKIFEANELRISDSFSSWLIPGRFIKVADVAMKRIFSLPGKRALSRRISQPISAPIAPS